MQDPSRRQFLRAASSIAIFSPAAVSAEDTGPHVAFPKNARDRLAVASYPFRAYIEAPTNRDRDKSKPGFDLLGFAKSVKADLGVHNIEPLNAHFASTDPDYVRRLRDDLKSIGIGVVNVAADVPGSLYDPDEEARKRAIDARAKWIDVVAELGSPSVRLNNPPAPGAKPDAALMAASLRLLGEHGARQRVIVNLENDNLVSEDALFLAEVIDQVRSPWVHALPDFCNSMLSGDEEFEYKALTELFKRAANICHVKEYEIGEADRVYRIDLARVFGILKRSGYRGFCSMEWEGKGDPYAGTRELLEKSLKYLS